MPSCKPKSSSCADVCVRYAPSFHPLGSVAIRAATIVASHRSSTMSKGMNQKKQEKKKPAKTLDEKRADKKAKKTERAGKQFL